MSETSFMKDVQLRFGAQPDIRLFRNNVGRLQAKDGSWVQFGLCVGSADLIGWKSVEVTPQMVGQRVAVFVALETKSLTGPRREAQTNFLRAVNNAGGLGGLVRYEKQVCQVLNIEDVKDTLGP